MKTVDRLINSMNYAMIIFILSGIFQYLKIREIDFKLELIVIGIFFLIKVILLKIKNNKGYFDNYIEMKNRKWL